MANMTEISKSVISEMFDDGMALYAGYADKFSAVATRFSPTRRSLQHHSVGYRSEYQ